MVNRTHALATMHLSWVTVTTTEDEPFVAGAFMTMKAAQDHADLLNAAEPGDNTPFAARFIGTLYQEGM